MSILKPDQIMPLQEKLYDGHSLLNEETQDLFDTIKHLSKELHNTNGQILKIMEIVIQ